jgi:hypothetical protein
MASKGGKEATAAEAERARKLKFDPVYEALEDNNFRKAVMFCEKKEVAGLPLAKVS